MLLIDTPLCPIKAVVTGIQENHMVTNPENFQGIITSRDRGIFASI